MADVNYEQWMRACFVAIGQMQRVHGDVLHVDVIRRGRPDQRLSASR
jgi:hypothetical protein